MARIARLRSLPIALAGFIDFNRRRLLILLLLLALPMFFMGGRTVLAGLSSVLGTGPLLVIQLLFMAFAGIAQFGAMMWFLSRPRKYVVTPDDPQIGLSFASYRGQPDLLDHARSTVRILRGAADFRARGGDMPKGMLMSGMPGTGKTFLASVIAAEAGLPFIYIDASSLSSMFMGVDALIVVALFSSARKLARKYAPPGEPGACILFIDELDSIGMSRGGVMGGAIMGGGMMGGGRFGLNTLLNQMDSMGSHVEDRRGKRIKRWLGLERGPVPEKPTVFVIGATNRPDVLDPALTRPGRLDRALVVYPPDGAGRLDIITHYLSGKAHEQNLPLDLMVADSIAWTPVQIKTIINEALIVALDDNRDRLAYRDWLTARDNRFLGIKQPITTMSTVEKRLIAYHEAGHAVVAHFVRLDDRTLKASIIRMGDSLGVIQRAPREERYTRHAVEIEGDIMVCLGARAVEELLLGTKMSGAGSDLAKATAMALDYVATFGMGASLLSGVSRSAESGEGLGGAEQLLDQLMRDTKRLITAKRAVVDAVAGALLARGELIGPELDAVFETAFVSKPALRRPFRRTTLCLTRRGQTTRRLVPRTPNPRPRPARPVDDGAVR